MKKLAMTTLIVLIACTSCKTFYPVSDRDSLDDSLLMNIDCRNDTALRQTIVFLLRTHKARDLKYTVTDPELNIQATFLKRELPLGKLNELTRDIENLGGGIEIRVENNPGTILQTINTGPTRTL
jgi:hypothetical protein